MAMKNLALFSVLIVAAALASVADGGRHAIAPAEAPADAPTQDCSSVVVSLMPCLEFLILGSTQANPLQECCIGVTASIKLGATCICYALKQSGASGVSLNLTRLSCLPSDCGIPSPPPKCQISDIPPGSAPFPSPSVPQLPPATPETPPSKPAPVDAPPADDKVEPVVVQATAPAPRSGASALSSSTILGLAGVVSLLVAL